jgi:fumarate hydratase class II
MMPIIAYCLFQEIDVTIGAVKAFTDKCVAGLTANKEKAEGWLAKNAIIATALNPVIGYQKGAEVVKKAMAENRGIREIVVELGYMSDAEAAKALDAKSMTDGGITDTPAGG